MSKARKKEGSPVAVSIESDISKSERRKAASSTWKSSVHDSLTKREIEKIVFFEESEPFDLLGPHFLKPEKCTVIRAFLPRASEAWVNAFGKKQGMEKIHSEGLFHATFDGEAKFPYKIGFRDQAGYEEERVDPYAFGTELKQHISDYDLYLLGEGSHFKSYEKFGAKCVSYNGTFGVQFTVWAPNAKSVSVIGNFNHWRPGAHPMSRVKFSGIWALFIPELKEGEVYKYAIRSSSDHAVQYKADPYAFQTELRPSTASVVRNLDDFKWRDQDWLNERAKKSFLNSPFSVYELHLGSWRRDGDHDWDFLGYRELAHQIVAHVKELGYTHIELLPISEHPLDQSWGYQVVGYFAPTSRFGTPEDFMYFVDYCHQNGIGVLLDWVPAHFPKDPHGLNNFDGSQVYAYSNWKKGEHKDWGTLIFDYGRTEIKNFLISNALFWLDRYHIDGLRVDAVASMLYLDYSRKEGEWEPNAFGGRENLEAIEFLKKFNEVVHLRFPGVLTIAEESTAWPGVSRPTYLGGLGFSMKWNMGWMHDLLEYFSKDPVYRKYHQGMLTFSLLYAFSENFVLPISHDEVVHGKRSLLEKMPGDDWQKFANLRLFLGFMFAHPGKKLNFMTNDIAQRREWNCEASMDWDLTHYDPHKGIMSFMKDLHEAYSANRAFYELDFDAWGFEWLDFSDSGSSVICFLRRSQDDKQNLLFTFNMTPVPHHGYRIGISKPGFYQEILNSDAQAYGGSGIGNWGGVHSENASWNGRPHSLVMNIPPLAVNVYRWEEAKGE